jgi:hypothetical protein
MIVPGFNEGMTMSKIIKIGNRDFIRVEEYSEEYEINGVDVLRVIVENNLHPKDLIVISDIRPEDKNTMDGVFEYVPCVSIYVSKS